MNKEEFIGKLQMVYVGDRNAFNDIVVAYDSLQSKVENTIERIKALIAFWKKYSPDNTMEIGQLEGLLDILINEEK